MMKCKRFVQVWLKIAIFSLAIAGFFSLLLVILRSPGANLLLPQNLFKQALIVHVNLSVLFWILSVSVINLLPSINIRFESLINIATKGALLSVTVITFSAFIPNSLALTCNYVPILQNLPFFLSLSLFLTAILIMSILVILSIDIRKLNLFYIKSESFINLILAISIIIALVGFVLSAQSLNPHLSNRNLKIEDFYELIFWGGGHLLQFCFINIMCIAWILKSEIQKKLRITLNVLLAFNLIFQMIGLGGYRFDILDPSHKLFFTWHMKYFAGVIPSIFAMLVLLQIIRANKFSNYKIIFIICSILLFASGGLISLTIQGENVTVPAHYHGSIVGITISLMGLILLYIEKYKFGQINNKLAWIQPLCYTVGQFLHIIGLAWSGGYGVLRKTPGGVLSIKAKISMALMGFGGLIAVLGGFLFIYICYKSLYQKNEDKNISSIVKKEFK
jgi:cytochrome c oxidase subunit 1